MLIFLATLAGGIAATLVVQVLDIECVNPPKPRAAGAKWEVKPALLNAIGVTR
jgi:hypothetical protein